MSVVVSDMHAYAVLADAAYVDLALVDVQSGADVAVEVAAQSRVPIVLARTIFDPEAGGAWETIHYNGLDNPASGFAATLFRRAQAPGSADEYVLAIRRTEPEGEQLRIDLVGADVGEIGFSGMAFSQTISLVNYVLRLISPAGPVAPQLALRTSADRTKPEGKGAFGVPGAWHWIEAGAPAQGLDAIPAGARIKVTGHSLGGHLAAIAARLFPDLITDAYAFNAPGCDPSTANAVVAAMELATPMYFSFLSPILRGGARQLTEEIIGRIGPFLPATPAASFSEIEAGLHLFEAEDIAPGDDGDLVAGTLTGAGFAAAQKIAVERNSHGMGQIADSLSLQTLFERVDFSGQSEVEALYRAATPDVANAQEALLASLHALFVNPHERLVLPTVEAGTRTSLFALPWISNGDFAARSSWYDAWASVEKVIPSGGGLKLVSLAGVMASR